MPDAAHPDIRAEALELRRLGWTLVDIASALDVSPQVVSRWSQQAGLVGHIKPPESAPKRSSGNRAPAPFARGYVWEAEPEQS